MGLVKIKELGKLAKQAGEELRYASSQKKDEVLEGVIKAITKNKKKIIQENKKDLIYAKNRNLSESMIDRLSLNSQRLDSIVKSLEDIIELPDPVGQSIAEFSRPNGLLINKVRTPLGVVGVIFESRPNVLIDAGALCLKAGNASILRCGSESLNTCRELSKCFTESLKNVRLPETCVQLVSTKDRSAVVEMLKMTEFIDVIIPRGGKKLVKVVQSEARVPVFAHLEGIVHIFVHERADPMKVSNIVLNSKTRRPGICGAVECVLIDTKFLKNNGTSLISDLVNSGLDVRVDSKLIHVNGTVLAKGSDWGKEYLNMSLAVKTVSDMGGAIEHIEKYGSNHTDCIITEDDQAATEFFTKLDSAILMRNTSTQFADGGEFGFGAEIGISTGKIHARGPVGLEQLTSFKYLVQSNGQLRD